ncbi:hypothetical protein R1X32_11850 [Rhodococcus opacus]
MTQHPGTAPILEDACASAAIQRTNGATTDSRTPRARAITFGGTPCSTAAHLLDQLHIVMAPHSAPPIGKLPRLPYPLVPLIERSLHPRAAGPPRITHAGHGSISIMPACAACRFPVQVLPLRSQVLIMTGSGPDRGTGRAHRWGRAWEPEHGHECRGPPPARDGVQRASASS